MAAGGIVITREAAEDADFVLSGTAPGIAAFVHGKVPLSQLGPLGVLTGEGDAALMTLFPGLFELPPKVALPPPVPAKS